MNIRFSYRFLWDNFQIFSFEKDLIKLEVKYFLLLKTVIFFQQILPNQNNFISIFIT